MNYLSITKKKISKAEYSLGSTLARTYSFSLLILVMVTDLITIKLSVFLFELDKILKYSRFSWNKCFVII